MANFPVAFQGSPITRGVQTGLAIKQRKKANEQAKARQEAEQLYQSHVARLARFDEEAKRILETTERAAAAGAGEEELKPLRVLFTTTIANRAKLQQQFKALALQSGTPPEAIESALPDAAQEVQNRMTFFDSAVQIGRAENEEAQTRTLTPEEVQELSPALPQGTVIQQKADGELLVKFEPGDDDDLSAFQERVAALMATDIPEKQALGIAAGRFAVSLDPITRERQVIDIATGERVGGEEPSAAPTGEAPSLIPEDVETPLATGGPGFVRNVANVFKGAFNAEPTSPKAQEAAAALRTVQVLTETTLQAAVPGRPSVFLLEEFKNLTVTPNSVFQGEAQSRDRLEQTKRLIDGEIARMEQDILPLDLDPKTRVETQVNLTQMKRLSGAYESLLEGFDEAAPVEIPEGVPDEAREVWEFLTPEQRKLFQQAGER